jgi:hypothetical protein
MRTALTMQRRRAIPHSNRDSSRLEMASRIFASWNQTAAWLRRIERVRDAA